jgi:uncharacterized protein DUF3862
MPWICPCGTSNADSARFCGGCGKPLAQPQVAAPPNHSLRLLIILLAALAIGAGLYLSIRPETQGSSNEQSEVQIVTKAKYDSVQAGMSYDQVRAIMGDPGEEISQSDIAGYTSVMYAWKNSNGSNMNALFQNGKLINKAQFGLR